MMSDPNGDPVGYARAFQEYHDKGWRGILPLRHGSKWPPPRDFTGYGNPDPSYADLMAWADDETFKLGNLGLRLPDGVVGIDVDEYGAKNGAATFAEAIRRWGPLPDAPRTTSREGNPISGIRLFAVPLGTMLKTKIDFHELNLGDVEVIQPHHRYAMSWPSIHPEGGTYWWRNDADQLVGIPELGELPLLPAAWLEGLHITHESNLELTPVDVASAITEGAASPMVLQRLGQAFQELNMPGCSRHDTCTKHVMALMRYGKSGEPGVSWALAQLGETLISIRAKDGSGDRAKTVAEFRRMVYGENLARELAKPGHDDAWVRELIVLQEEVEPPPKIEVPTGPAEPMGEGDSKAPSTNAGCIVDDSRPKSPLELIEGGFWESRESLASIYQTALAQMASPWAVLGICAARALVQVRPNVTLPALIGSPGSLNWFVALVARSGGGKGAASGAANFLIPRHTFTQRTLGSGEGLVKLFDRPKDAGVDDDVNEAILVNVDEVDTLTALSQRSASTTISVLKQGFMGEALGFSYVNRANMRDVKDHGYRMTLVVSVQPKKSGGMFADEGGGLPQRFMWFPASDQRIDMVERWPSTPLTLPHPREWLYPREIAVPDETRYAIRLNRMKNGRDQLDALDGHALFCREKFAYALAVLDGRVHMTLEDWELSGVAAEISDFTREACQAELKEAARLDAVERGQLRGVEMDAADIERLEEQVKRGQRVMKWLLHHLDDAPDGYMTQTDLMRKISSRDRKSLSEILASGNQLIHGVLVDGTVRWSRA